MEINILTYNMHKGFSAGGRRAFVLEHMRAALAASGADIVFLQEALGAHSGHARRYPSWPDTSQFEYLADTLWPHFAYGRNAIYARGHHGNAILSRYPLLDWENVPLSPYPFAASRSLLHACVAIPPGGPRLHLVCVHFGFLGVERRAQIRRLCRHIAAHVPPGEALVIGGDFNDWSGRAERTFDTALGLDEAYRSLHGHHARTYPSWAPVLPMDRVYYRGLRLLAARPLAGAPWRQLSDHMPLEARFKLPAARAERLAGAR